MEEMGEWRMAYRKYSKAVKSGGQGVLIQVSPSSIFPFLLEFLPLRH